MLRGERAAARLHRVEAESVQGALQIQAKLVGVTKGRKIVEAEVRSGSQVSSFFCASGRG
jgi:hypothetical protein